jgi:hypothetical protein
MKDEIQTCNHIKENGTFCGSPSLAGRDYCYFHLRLRVRRVAMARARAHGQRWRLDLPALEDMYSVQVALMRVIEALADDQIDNRRAGLILYGLQQAATNLRAADAWGEECNRFEVCEDTGGLAEHYDCMEAEFGLPEDAELDDTNGWAFPKPEVEGVAQKSPSAESPMGHEEVATMLTRAQALLEDSKQSVALKMRWWRRSRRNRWPQTASARPRRQRNALSRCKIIPVRSGGKSGAG